jgi:multidrug efflux system outer membrane protein
MAMRIHLPFLPALLALGLAGCAVGPNYHRPDTRAPAALRGQEAAASPSLADAAWWDLYQDPVLTGLVRSALADGFDVRIATARLEQARAIEHEVRGQLFPAIGYQADADRGRNSTLGRANPSGTGTVGDSFDGYLSAGWEFDLWGRVRRLDEAARDRYLAGAENRRGVELSLVAEVATDYFQLLELDEELAISRRAADSFGQTLELFNRRLQGGIASKLETSSAQAAQAAAAARIPEVEREIAILENSLSVLLGHAPGDIARGAPLAGRTLAPEIPAGLPSALLERRPDVRAAEYAAASANAQIGVTIGGFLPRIGLSGLLGGASQHLQGVTSGQGALWSVGAQVTGPVFQAGALHGEYVQARQAWEEARLEYQQTALRAFADAANALVTRQKLAEVRTQQEIEVRSYQEAASVADQRYRGGQIGYFELLQTQQLLFPAESALAQTRRDELISVVQLYKALGGGWNLKDPSDWAGPAP